jgi:hypothetical protein
VDKTAGRSDSAVRLSAIRTNLLTGVLNGGFEADLPIAKERCPAHTRVGVDGLGGHAGSRSRQQGGVTNPKAPVTTSRSKGATNKQIMLR